MKLIITQAGKKKLKELGYKVAYGGALDEERTLGSLLDYIKIWQPIEEKDPIFLEEKPEATQGSLDIFNIRRRMRGAFEAGYIEDLDK